MLVGNVTGARGMAGKSRSAAVVSRAEAQAVCFKPTSVAIESRNLKVKQKHDVCLRHRFLSESAATDMDCRSLSFPTQARNNFCASQHYRTVQQIHGNRSRRVACIMISSLVIGHIPYHKHEMLVTTPARPQTPWRNVLAHAHRRHFMRSFSGLTGGNRSLT